MTTIRKEPTVSLLTKAGELVGFKVRGQTNDDLVNEALEAFTAAEEKMNSAIVKIDENVREEQEAIREATNRIEKAGQSKARLTRVIDRLKALTE